MASDRNTCSLLKYRSIYVLCYALYNCGVYVALKLGNYSEVKRTAEDRTIWNALARKPST